MILHAKNLLKSYKSELLFKSTDIKKCSYRKGENVVMYLEYRQLNRELRLHSRGTIITIELNHKACSRDLRVSHLMHAEYFTY